MVLVQMARWSTYPIPHVDRRSGYGLDDEVLVARIQVSKAETANFEQMKGLVDSPNFLYPSS